MKETREIQCKCGAFVKRVTATHKKAPIHQEWLVNQHGHSGNGASPVLLDSPLLCSARDENYEPCNRKARHIFIGTSVCIDHLKDAYRA